MLLVRGCILTHKNISKENNLMLQSKYNRRNNHHKLLPVLVPTLVLTLFSLLSVVASAGAALSVSIPTLNWQKRSDWINVKTDVRPAAFGDGAHDDTAAIQAALNQIDDKYVSQTKTVYLPPGTYRISKTLILTRAYGAMIVGHGGATRLIWTGPLNQPMFVSNGAPFSRYVGLTWDGRGVASVGIDHRSRNYFETRVRHEDEAFLNFREAGIRVGANQVVASAEIMFRNCFFQKCVNGVSFLNYNDYDNDFDGCAFQDCGTGVNCLLGNVYVRNCNFIHSQVTDLFLCPHSHSVRRCTSVGSKQFILTANNYNGCEVTVEDCHVDGWTGSQGAITFASRGPNLVFDCSFTHPPDRKPPIRLTNWWNGRQLISVSNNTAPDSPQLIDQGFNSGLIHIPAGARGGNLTDTSRTFLKSVETVPSNVIDVKTSFHARGDARGDDTAAILSAIAVAKEQGGGTVYLPPGIYNISETLPLTGGGYTVEGAGWGTIIQWVGNGTGPVFSVQDPQNITLEQMRIYSPDSVARIQQTSATGDGKSAMTYDGITVEGSWLDHRDIGGVDGHIYDTRTVRGIELTGLPAQATVHFIHLDGSVHFHDCSRATILINDSFEGVIQVDGADYEKSGFLGCLMRLGTGAPSDHIILDDQNYVATNYYCEQTQSSVYAAGDGAYSGKPGRITISGTRSHTYGPALAINDYQGSVTLMGAQIDGPMPRTVTQTGSHPVTILLMNNMQWIDEETYQLDSGAQLASLQNLVVSNSMNNFQRVVKNVLPGISDSDTASLLSSVLPTSSSPAPLVPSAPTSGSTASLADAAAALDDFRLLGAVDLAINHP